MLTRAAAQTRATVAARLAKDMTPRWIAGPGACVRELNLHEYQSKSLLDQFNVTTQRGEMAETADAARRAAEKILARNPNAEIVVKAQIHAGGRGKGSFTDGYKGGVKVVRTAKDAEEAARRMLGNTLVTIQTGPAGQKCAKVLVNEGVSINSEKYFAILMDRSYNGPVMVASPAGGMDIEKVAHDTPEKIYKEAIDVVTGPRPEQTKRLAEKLGFKPHNVAAAQKQMEGLYKLFISKDATQVEINPLAEAKYSNEQETVFAVDAKLNFDDNALYRQPDVVAMRDKSMEDARDVKAEELGLNFISLPGGSIGSLVNGAGLAMATLDIISLKGGKCANFLDVGGGATPKMVTEAFRLITSDPEVKGILVNIFGGIMKCSIIAQGIVQAFKEVNLRVPLVVRLEGTEVELGKKIFAESGMPIITADNLDDAAEKIVAAVKKAGKKN